MDSIAERMLQSKGIYNLMEIMGLASNSRVFGYVDASYKIFHVCDIDLNILDLRNVFGKRYVVLMRTDDTYIVGNRSNQTAAEQNVYYLGLLDTDNGTIDSNEEYQELNDGHFILPEYHEELLLNKSFISKKPLPKSPAKNKDSIVIINDIMYNVDGALVLGNYVLTSFPFVLYGKDGNIIRSFPADYYLKYLISFNNGGFVFWLFSDTEELLNQYMIYVGKDDNLFKIIIKEEQLPRCLLDDISGPNGYFDDNAVLLACDDIRSILHRYCIIDNKGEIETGSVNNLICGYRNGFIISEGSYYPSLKMKYYDSRDKRLSGSHMSGDQYAVFTRRIDDPFSLNGTKELKGLVRLEDMSVIVPFKYDDVESDEREYYDSGKWVHYVTAIVSINITEKTRYGLVNRRRCGLYKNGDLLMPLSEENISAIRVKTYYENTEEPFNVFSGYYARHKTCGYEIMFCDSECTYEVDSYSVITLDDLDEPTCILLVEKDGAYAIMKDGQLISDYKYSCVEVAKIREYDCGYYCHNWLIVNGVGKSRSLKGVFNLSKGEVIPPLFSSINKCGDIFVADDYLFSLEGKLLFDPKSINAEGEIKFSFDQKWDVAIICGNNLYNLKGERRIDADSLGLSFICHYDDVVCFTSPEGDYVFMDYSGERLLQGSDYVLDDNGTYVFTDRVNEGLVFIPSKNLFYKKEYHETDENDQYDYPQEQYDYEEDTYYALGGDDYQRFKENGGSIDDMMDGMGL